MPALMSMEQPNIDQHPTQTRRRRSKSPNRILVHRSVSRSPRPARKPKRRSYNKLDQKTSSSSAGPERRTPTRSKSVQGEREEKECEGREAKSARPLLQRLNSEKGVMGMLQRSLSGRNLKITSPVEEPAQFPELPPKFSVLENGTISAPPASKADVPSTLSSKQNEGNSARPMLPRLNSEKGIMGMLQRSLSGRNLRITSPFEVEEPAELAEVPPKFSVLDTSSNTSSAPPASKEGGPSTDTSKQNEVNSAHSLFPRSNSEKGIMGMPHRSINGCSVSSSSTSRPVSSQSNGSLRMASPYEESPKIAELAKQPGTMPSVSKVALPSLLTPLSPEDTEDTVALDGPIKRTGRCRGLRRCNSKSSSGARTISPERRRTRKAEAAPSGRRSTRSSSEDGNRAVPRRRTSTADGAPKRASRSSRSSKDEDSCGPKLRRTKTADGALKRVGRRNRSSIKSIKSSPRIRRAKTSEALTTRVKDCSRSPTPSSAVGDRLAAPAPSSRNGVRRTKSGSTSTRQSLRGRASLKELVEAVTDMELKKSRSWHIPTRSPSPSSDLARSSTQSSHSKRSTPSPSVSSNSGRPRSNRRHSGKSIRSRSLSSDIDQPPLRRRASRRSTTTATAIEKYQKRQAVLHSTSGGEMLQGMRSSLERDKAQPARIRRSKSGSGARELMKAVDGARMSVAAARRHRRSQSGDGCFIATPHTKTLHWDCDQGDSSLGKTLGGNSMLTIQNPAA